MSKQKNNPKEKKKIVTFIELDNKGTVRYLRNNLNFGNINIKEALGKPAIQLFKGIPDIHKQVRKGLKGVDVESFFYYKNVSYRILIIPSFYKNGEVKKVTLSITEKDIQNEPHIITSPDFVLTVDRHMKVLSSNHSSLDFASENIIGSDILSYIDQGNMNKFAETIENVFNQKENKMIEYTNAGTYFESRFVPLMENGNAYAVIIISTDITNRIEAEKVLRQQAGQMEALMRTTTEGFCITDSKGRLKLVNQAYCDMTGYTKEELLTMSISQLEGVDSEEKIESNLRFLMEKGSLLFETMHIKKDGSFFNVQANVAYDQERNEFIGFVRDITSSKLSEKTIRLQSEQMDILMKTTTEGFWIVDITGKIKLVNQVYSDMIGYSIDELLGMSIFQLEAVDSVEQINSNVELFIKNGFGIFETKHKRKDGSLIDVQISLTYDKERHEFINFLRDITNQKMNENALKVSEEKYRFITTNSADMISIHNAEGKVLFVSPASITLTGYSPDEIIGKGAEFLLFPEEQENVWNIVNNGLQTSDSYIVEHRLPHKNGDVIWVETKGKCFRDSAGYIKEIICNVRDITERKMAQESLLIKDRAIDSSINGIAFGDVNGKLTYVNNSFLKTWGYQSKEEVIGKNGIDFLAHPETATNILGEILKHGGWTGELLAKAKDGKEFHVELTASIVRDKSGNIISLFSSTLDITERVIAKKRLNASLEEKDILLKEIHHRVKNNLQIIGSLIFMQGENSDNLELRSELLKIQNRIKSIGLVHEYLYRSVDILHINFCKYVNGLISVLRESFDSLKMNLSFEVLVSENIKLEQVIYCGLIINELVSNSIKHAFVGRPDGKIKISLEKNLDNFILLVEDDGIGKTQIPIEIKGGIGLKLIEILCDQIKGKMKYNSSNGTKAEITFPA